MYSSLKDGNIDSEYILDFLVNSEDGGAKHLADYKKAFNPNNTFFETFSQTLNMNVKGMGDWKSAASGGGSGYIYGSPESDILWGISAASAVVTQINIANSFVETAYRQSILLPRSIDINTGAITWANPVYAKIMKFTQPLGLGGDIANSLGIMYNFADQGVTTENVLDATMGAIGYYPILGDILSGDYAVQKYNINQVVTGKATLVPGIMGPVYQYIP